MKLRFTEKETDELFIIKEYTIMNEHYKEISLHYHGRNI